MSINEALEYVDLVIEELHDDGTIPEDKYGKMTENRRQEIAEKVSQKSEE